MMMVLNATLPGHTVPTHSHPHEQIGMVYSDSLQLQDALFEVQSELERPQEVETQQTLNPASRRQIVHQHYKSFNLLSQRFELPNFHQGDNGHSAGSHHLNALTRALRLIPQCLSDLPRNHGISRTGVQGDFQTPSLGRLLPLDGGEDDEDRGSRIKTVAAHGSEGDSVSLLGNLSCVEERKVAPQAGLRSIDLLAVRAVSEDNSSEGLTEFVFFQHADQDPLIFEPSVDLLQGQCCTGFHGFLILDSHSLSVKFLDDQGRRADCGKEQT